MSREPQWGTYTLLIECTESVKLEVGALGEYEFEPGAYAYTGSALGSGGFARVERHHRTASGENDTLHWHIDYLLADDRVSIHDVVTASGYAIECEVATELTGDGTPKFGVSDCSCASHLHYMEEMDELEGDVWTAYVAVMNESN